MSKYAVVRREPTYYEGEPQNATHIFMGFDTWEEAKAWIPNMDHHEGYWEAVEVFDKDDVLFKHHKAFGGTITRFNGIKK